jgi:hypothetical protein
MELQALDETRTTDTASGLDDDGIGESSGADTAINEEASGEGSE